MDLSGMPGTFEGITWKNAMSQDRSLVQGMSDSDFVDVGDELVMKICGYPVGTVEVLKTITTFDGEKKWHTVFRSVNGEPIYYFYLPLDIKKYDVTDGVNHFAGYGDDGFASYGDDERGALSE